MEKTLLERISENPEVIAELTREELEEAKSALLEAGKAYTAALKSGESDDKKADLEAAKEAKDRLEAVKARLDEFEAEDAEIQTKATELSEAFEEPEAEETEEEPKAEEETEEVETPEVETPVVEEEEPEAIAAAAKPSVSAIAKRAPKTKTPAPEYGATAGGLVASEYQGGLRSPEDVVQAMIHSWKRAAGNQETLVASFDTSKQYAHELKRDPEHDTAEISAAIDEYKAALRTNVNAMANMTPEALVATGPCAPSQPVYDFFSISQTAGMLQVPGASAPRGGLIYPVSSSYATVRDTAAWSAAAGQQTETTKLSYTVACPSTTECTVVPFPVILQFTNMQQRFYPEFIAHSVEESMRFHEHFINATHIAAAVTASTAIGGGDTGGGGLVNVANIVNNRAMRYRDNYRMAPESVLELVVPAWVIDALVADLVARNATTDFGNARARVLALFASLNLSVQAVQDWQSPADNADNGWLLAADMLLYAPGTFVKLDGGNLNLGIVRDSTLNADNYFQIMEETFEVLCEVGHDSWLLDDVTICPRGIAAADATLDCNPGLGS